MDRDGRLANGRQQCPSDAGPHDAPSPPTARFGEHAPRRAEEARLAACDDGSAPEAQRLAQGLAWAAALSAPFWAVLAASF